MGPAEWGRCDLQQLMCTSGGGVMEDPFDPLPEGTGASRGPGIGSYLPELNNHPPSEGQVEAIATCRLGSVGCLTKPWWSAPMGTSASLCTNTQCVTVLTMAGGTALKARTWGHEGRIWCMNGGPHCRMIV